jgi:hypothetical protein
MPFYFIDCFHVFRFEYFGFEKNGKLFIGGEKVKNRYSLDRQINTRSRNVLGQMGRINYKG